MPIAPITGKLRKHFWLDLGVGFSLGISAGYAYWYGIHLKACKSIYMHNFNFCFSSLSSGTPGTFLC
ncbi:hypothetical protein M378DRAFT_157534 [Amanita muscaria Koide BX008]|uniref:Uncharacterized protein n=1 Tax=Amanita muscaria (strain Koide BX008) TaxID=946122 RepID=A0A0C2X4T5_AMAMK|nr:hypothetical protein M378DRAFT_157534 [Amanita muscaria Koide BX008]